ncbi:MAG TPA: hypothetical protein VMU41_01810 [Candidatus Binataceae bacterium]|nr:hypothetical protein [Candidatus Binataceae bacterium]
MIRPVVTPMELRNLVRWVGRFGLGACLLIAITGCSSQRDPLTVEVTQLAPYDRAAKAPDCNMPILDTLPLTNYTQVAIVEAWADLKDQPDQVMPELRRKACETGADALVVVNSAHQDIKNLLYRATPNEAQTDVDAKNGSTNQAGDYIREAEHTRRLGEAGHNGFYIDAVAIDYVPTNRKTGSDGSVVGSLSPND